MTTLHSANTVIECTDLGKCYQIYDSPKARLKQALWRGRKQYYKEFWALKNINFTVKRGESLGIIGRNGSGKSTLLQLICGTLTPTVGTVHTQGRIAALLELGSGFNPEFTGIENVYLNSSMLGLSQAETETKLDDILAFADIGEFISQPVKTYSSGMALRLAFAVIAHINADILIVDEALSVGDAFFTQKCMRFINRFREDNCLLFVSHDPAAIATLCSKSIMLRRGKLAAINTSKKVLEFYNKEIYSDFQEVEHSEAVAEGEILSSQQTEESYDIEHSDWIDYRTQLINASRTPNLFTITKFKENLFDAESFGSGKATIKNVLLIDSFSKKPMCVGLGGERVILRIEAISNDCIENPIIGFLLKNEKGLTLLGDNTLNERTHAEPQKNKSIQKETAYYAEFEFTLPLLPSGKYSFTTSLAEGTQQAHTQLEWMNDAVTLEFINSCVAAGLAGVPMHRITLETVNNIS